MILLPTPCSLLPSTVSRPPSPVSRFPSPVSPSPVSPSPVSRLPVHRLPFPVFAPGLGVCSFFARPKKEPKKGAPSPYRSVANAFALWASTALNTGRRVYPAFQAVDPIRRSRSSNGNGVSHGLRAAEGKIQTEAPWAKVYVEYQTKSLLSPSTVSPSPVSRPPSPVFAPGLGVCSFFARPKKERGGQRVYIE